VKRDATGARPSCTLRHETIWRSRRLGARLRAAVPWACALVYIGWIPTRGPVVFEMGKLVSFVLAHTGYVVAGALLTFADGSLPPSLRRIGWTTWALGAVAEASVLLDYPMFAEVLFGSMFVFLLPWTGLGNELARAVLVQDCRCGSVACRKSAKCRGRKSRCSTTSGWAARRSSRCIGKRRSRRTTAAEGIKRKAGRFLLFGGHRQRGRGETVVRRRAAVSQRGTAVICLVIAVALVTRGRVVCRLPFRTAQPFVSHAVASQRLVSGCP
jgi:hypothetical protein